MEKFWRWIDDFNGVMFPVWIAFWVLFALFAFACLIIGLIRI